MRVLHPRHLLPAVFVLVVGVALAHSLFASQDAEWKVVVTANAFISHGTSTEFEPAAMGAAVRAGDRLTTRAGGALVISRGQDVVTLAENTQIAIADPQPVSSTLIEQPYGQAHYKVEHQPVPHFEVDTPLVATVVKGTTFTVHASATEGSVSVQEGRVTAVDRRSGAAASVGSGETGTVNNSSRAVSVTHTAPAASDDGAAAPGQSPSDNASANSAKEKSSDKSKDNAGGNGNSGSGNSGNGNGNSGSSNGNSGGNNGNGNGGGNGGGKGKGKDK